jgi:hypothetical protein
MHMAPEGVSTAKAPIVIGFPQPGTMLAIYLRHDYAKWPDFAERQKMNTRQIIEVLKRRIKSGVMMLGASSTVRARAFGDGPDSAAVRTLKEVRAFGERVPDVITRG